MAEKKYVPRLKEEYYQTVRDALQKQFGYANVNQIPKFEKIVVNMGVGEAATDAKAIDGAVSSLPLSFVRVCPLVQKLPFAAIACGSSWIA